MFETKILHRLQQFIFSDWSEPDTRAFVRRDRNCPSVIIWSFGNEVGEQYTGEEGAAIAKRLYDIIKEEDPTCSSTSAMNNAKPSSDKREAFSGLCLAIVRSMADIPGFITVTAKSHGLKDAHIYIKSKPLVRLEF